MHVLLGTLLTVSESPQGFGLVDSIGLSVEFLSPLGPSFLSPTLP